MKLTAIDIFAIILSFLVISGFSISAYAGKGAARDVMIEASGTQWIYQLNVSDDRPHRTFTVLDPPQFAASGPDLGLVGRSLFCLEAIMNERRRLDRKNIIGRIDALLVSVKTAGEPDPSLAEAAVKDLPKIVQNVHGLAVLSIMVAVNWVVFLLPPLHRRPFWGG